MKVVNILDYIENDNVDVIKNEQYKKWIMEFFKGDSFFTIANKYSVPQYKVRSIVYAFVKNTPEMKEDIYEYLISNYNISDSEFTQIFNEELYVYNYLVIKHKLGTKKLSLYKYDLKIPAEIKGAIDRFFNNIKTNKDHREYAIKYAVKYTAVNKRAFNRVSKRVQKEFEKKFYLGDIVVYDDEYAELLNWVKTQIAELERTRRPFKDVPLMVIAFIQIGIRRYDGAFWPNAGEELNIKLNAEMCKNIGLSVVNTLKEHGKYVISESEKVNTIMFHTFVSNYYSKGIFELLFNYYVKDLERDIQRNTKEQMEALMETLDQTTLLGEKASEEFTDNFTIRGSKAYKLRYHTLSAISANHIHSTMRLRRIIRLIDRAFWKDQVPANPISRLTILFKEWRFESPNFIQDYERYQRGEIRNRGKKHFSFPYLYADLNRTLFYVKIPEQIVKKEFYPNLKWIVKIENRTEKTNANPYLVLSGCKTEQVKLEISDDELFKGVECYLYSGDVEIKKFVIKPDIVRFFDMEGDYASKLFKVPMCAFTKEDHNIKSSALINTINYGTIRRWDFEFEDGDIVVLPNNQSMVVGEKYKDGFLYRGYVQHVRFEYESSYNESVYSNYPQLLIAISSNKINGTLLNINGYKCSLKECEYTFFETGDSSGKSAVLIDLSQFELCKNNSINKVVVDVPGRNYVNEYVFLLSLGLRVDFENSPYVFTDKAAVVFPKEILVKSNDNLDKLVGANGFTLNLDEKSEYLNVMIGENELPILVDIPVLKWSTDEEKWNLFEMREVWHTEFPDKIYFHSPKSKIKIETDSENPYDDDSENYVVAQPRNDGIYTVDLTRFKSWITKDRLRHNISLSVDGKTYSFAQVYTKNAVFSIDIFADFENSGVVFKFDIVGKSDNYIDIVNLDTGETIVEKEKLIGNNYILHRKNLNGTYKVTVFEGEEDDSGFDDIMYYELRSEVKKVIDKNDLSAKKLSVKKANKINSMLSYYFTDEYKVVSLERENSYTYYGLFMVNDKLTDIKIKIFFDNLDKISYPHLYFWDDYEEDYIDLMFDKLTNKLVKEETDNLKPAERYLRYTVMYDTDFCFYCKFYDEE